MDVYKILERYKNIKFIELKNVAASRADFYIFMVLLLLISTTESG